MQMHMQMQASHRLTRSTTSSGAAVRTSASRQLARLRCPASAAASSNGNGNGVPVQQQQQQVFPTPAETARTVAALTTEAVLCCTTPDGAPLGTPVGYSLDAAGNATIVVAAGSPEAAHVAASPRVSLLVQPIAYPARGVASVALQGCALAAPDQGAAPDGTLLLSLEVESAVYYGGLDQVCG
jgi:hypothetical protein